jgi:hypothetical protein
MSSSNETAALPDAATASFARRGAEVALRFAFVAAIAGLLARGVRWNDLWVELRGVRPSLLVAVVALNGCLMTIKAVRLRLLLTPHETTVAACFSALLRTSAINNVAPLRAGDVARLWMLERSAGVTKGAALAVSAVEHLVEIAALALVTLAAALAAPTQRWAVLAAPVVLVVAVLAATLLALLTRASRSAKGPIDLTTRVGRLVASLASFRERIHGGAATLRSPTLLAQTVGLSVVAWLCEATMVIVCARALGMTIPPALAIILLLGINLALTVPSTPAGTGPFEGAAVVVLTLAGWAKPEALAFALVYHLIQVVPVTVSGLAVAAGTRTT